MKSKLVFYWDGNKQEFDIRYSDPNGKRRGIFKVKDLNKEVKGENQYHKFINYVQNLISCLTKESD